ncbi:MAG: hypothetical protein AAGA55_11700 [Planctomycetota bacterium]
MEKTQPTGCRRALRFLFRTTLVLILIFVLAVGFFAWRGSWAPAGPQNRLAEWPMPWADAPASDRAWSIYQEAHEVLPPPPEIPDPGAGLLSTKRTKSIITGGPPDPALADQVVAYLDDPSTQSALDLYRTGAARRWLAREPETPAFGAPTFTVYGLEFDHLTQLRGAARLLTTEAWVAAKRGERDLVLDNIEAALGIARQTLAEQHTISILTSQAIEALASSTILEISHAHPEIITDEWLGRAIGTHRSHISIRPESFSTASEQMLAEDRADLVYTPSGAATSRGLRLAFRSDSHPAKWHPLHDTLLAPIALFSPGRSEAVNATNEEHSEFERISAMKPWEAMATAELATLQQQAMSKWEPSFAHKILWGQSGLPAFSAMFSHWKIQADLDAHLAALQILRLERQLGRVPAADEVAPFLPPDPFDGAPLRYVTTGNSWTLYSIGSDRDDDTGRHAQRAGTMMSPERADRLCNESPAEYDGDHVHWPPTQE